MQKATNKAPLKKRPCTKGDVTIPGPRISVGEQLEQVLTEVRAVHALIKEAFEEADTEEYSSGEEEEEEA